MEGTEEPRALRSERFTLPWLGGVELHTLRIDRADAATLVLLHGEGANAHWWDHLAPRLAEHFRVIALDFRGHGDSDHPEFRAPGAFDQDLDALIEHVDAPDAILMGHSMGAHVALRAAARRPELRAVVAIEASRGGRRGERRRARLALAARRTYASRDEAVDRFQFLPRAPRAPEALRAAIASHSVREETAGRFGYKFDAGWFGAGSGEPPDPACIACPVLIVRGAESRLLTAAGAAEWVAGIPNASLVEIPDAGHNVHIECPDAVLAAIDAFLAPFR